MVCGELRLRVSEEAYEWVEEEKTKKTNFNECLVNYEGNFVALQEPPKAL